MKLMTRSLFCLSFFVSIPLGAHHATTPVYDVSRTITIEGAVIEYRLENPHSMIALGVVDETGARVDWQIELAGRLSLSRRGWTDDTFSVGDRMTVTGNPTHTGSPGLWFHRIVLDDGTEFLAPFDEDFDVIEQQRRERARQREQQN